MQLTDNIILEGFRSFDPEITKEYFYGYCRRAYLVLDNKYQLHNKVGLDFYSLAHEYYLQLLSHGFAQLDDHPEKMKLSAFMFKGFWFVTMDALKAYKKEFENTAESDDMLQFVRSAEYYEDMLFEVAEAVASHYNDRIMPEIAHMIIYAGFKQKEVAEQLGITPSAVNQRYKKMMEEVVTPFVIENYSKGLDSAIMCKQSAMLEDACEQMPESLDYRSFTESSFTISLPSMDARNTQRIADSFITSLKPNEIFVFGSNLHGIHAGGAARTARLHFGAEMGKGVGIQGQSYAIPTMQGGVETIRPYVDEFMQYALAHPEQNFLVTEIGCGIAGFEPSDIAPLFEKAKDIQNIFLPQSFWDIIE